MTHMGEQLPVVWVVYALLGLIGSLVLRCPCHLSTFVLCSRSRCDRLAGKLVRFWMGCEMAMSRYGSGLDFEVRAWMGLP